MFAGLLGGIKMNYDEFVSIVKNQDSRNIFRESTAALNELPEELKHFYEKYDPADVEIVLKDLTSIKLYPKQDLLSLQMQYRLGEGRFVFATREGDPIAFEDGKIITCAHGNNSIKVEVISINFEEYLDIISEMMKIK